MTAKEYPSATTITPKWIQTHTKTNAQSSPSPQNTIEYNPAIKWPKCLHQHETQYATILCIHNPRTPPWNPQLFHSLTSNILELYNTRIKINPIQHTPIEYKVKFAKLWRTTPKTTHHNNLDPLPDTLYHINTLEYNLQQCTYIDGSFIPLDVHSVGNNANLRVYSPNNDLHIVERLFGLPNILHVELYALFMALIAT